MLLNNQTIQNAKLNFAHRETKGDLYDYYIAAMKSDSLPEKPMNEAVNDLIACICPSATREEAIEIVLPYTACALTSFKMLNKTYGIESDTANHDLSDTLLNYLIPADTIPFIYNGHRDVPGTVYDKNMKKQGTGSLILTYTQGIYQESFIEYAGKRYELSRNAYKFADNKALCVTNFDDFFLYTHIPDRIASMSVAHVDFYLSLKGEERKIFSGHSRLLRALERK